MSKKSDELFVDDDDDDDGDDDIDLLLLRHGLSWGDRLEAKASSSRVGDAVGDLDTCDNDHHHR